MSPCAAARPPSGALRLRNIIVPRCVAPNDSACSSCSGDEQRERRIERRTRPAHDRRRRRRSGSASRDRSPPAGAARTRTARSRPTTPSAHRTPMVTPSKPVRAPVERREAVIDRVARLDEAAGRRDREERRLAQMAVPGCRARASPARRAEAERARASRRRRRSCRQRSARSGSWARCRSKQQAAGQVRHDERDRAPQPHRSVGAAALAQALAAHRRRSAA